MTLNQRISNIQEQIAKTKSTLLRVAYSERIDKLRKENENN